MHQEVHIITANSMKINHSNNRSSNDKDLKIFPSSLDKQERSTSTESTISTGHNIKDMILSPIAACKSPSTNVVTPPGYYCCTPPHSAPSSPPPKHDKSNHQHHHIGQRKSAVYRNRTSPPLCGMKKSIPKTRSRSTPSLLSSGRDSHGEEKCKGQTSPAAAVLLNGENLLDKAVKDSSWSDVESSYSYSSRDQLLSNNNNNNIHRKAMVSRQQQPYSCSSYDCNYKYTQESAYEDFGVERKLIDRINKKGQSSSAQQSSERAVETKKKKTKHLIRLRQSVSTQLPAATAPHNKSLVIGVKKPTLLGVSPLTLPPSGKSSFTPKKSPPRAAVRRSAPPTYFQVDIINGSQYSSSSVGYHSAPIETELRPDRSLSQMGMEVTEEDYCIEGGYMTRQFQKQEQQRQQAVSGHSTNHEGRGNKKANDSTFSMKELTKGLEGLSTRNSRSPKSLKTKVLSALRRGNNSDTVVTKDVASDKKKKIPHQIAIAVTPSSSEDTGDDHLSLHDMKMLYKWQHARSRRDFNQFSSSRGGVVSCSPDGNWNHVETAVTKIISEDMSITSSSVGDRTVSVDNRRCSVKRQFSF